MAGHAFYTTVEAMAAEFERLSQAGDIEGVLAEIKRIVQACILDRRSMGKVMADSMLDAYCQAMGQKVLIEISKSALDESEVRVDCVVLATELYRTGGHSAVIGDLLNTGRFGPRTVVMLTDALSTADPAIAEERFGSMARVEMAPAGTLHDKLRWTLNRLLALRPRKLVLMNHPHDSVAIAAAQPRLADHTVFYHHADALLCLGVTLEHAMHVDPHPMGFHSCHELVGVSRPVYWPLTVKDLGTRPKARFLSSGRLRTCSSGSNNKFETPYKYAYSDVLPRLMAQTDGVHVHIGPLASATLARIQAALTELGVPADRFVHVPWVPSVWRALHDYQVDVYIDSFPLGGGKAVIECMGAGVPVIAHDCYITSLLDDVGMMYPSAFSWARPAQLVQHLGALSTAQLARESVDARRHFERFHTPDALLGAIDAGFDATPAPAPRSHSTDPMQVFLDDVNFALNDHLTAPLVANYERRAMVQAAEMEALERAVELETAERARLAGARV